VPQISHYGVLLYQRFKTLQNKGPPTGKLLSFSIEPLSVLYCSILSIPRDLYQFEKDPGQFCSVRYRKDHESAPS
jgi:hypothetical protein